MAVITIPGMEDGKIGAAYRAVRIRRRLTQLSLAEAAGVTQSDVSRLERGRLAMLTFETVRRIGAALEMWLEITPRWRGADIDRLVNSAHAALQGAVLRRFVMSPGWTAIPEVSFAIWGERGAIDILAWHAATRTLLFIELKTMLVDPGELVRKIDQRRPLALDIARGRGWAPRTIATWVILTDTRTNRRHVAAHATVLAPLMHADGARMGAWLRDPVGPVSGLSFWREPHAVIRRRVGTTRTRVNAKGAGRDPHAEGSSRKPSGDP